MRRIGQYFSAIFEDWTGRMSGGMSVFLSAVAAIWPLYFSDIHHVRTALWISAGVCFFLANFHVWLRERRALEAEIAKHAGSDLQGQIRLGYVDKSRLIPSTGWEKIPQGCLVTLYVDVVNHNPQVAYPRADWTTLQIKLNGVAHKGTCHHVVNGLEVDDARLAIKTLTDWFDGVLNGLHQSLPKLGYMQFLVPTFPVDLMFGRDNVIVEATVTITDTLGKKHILSNGNIALAVDKLRGVTYLTVRQDV